MAHRSVYPRQSPPTGPRYPTPPPRRPMSQQSTARHQPYQHHQHQQQQQQQQQQRNPSRKAESRSEVLIALSGLPAETRTIDIFRALKRFGRISKIELFDERGTSRRSGRAEVTFSPPPDIAFWENQAPLVLHFYDKHERVWHEEIRCQLRDQKPVRWIDSPIEPSRKYLEQIVLNAASLDFGCFDEPHTMMRMRTIQHHHITLTLDLFRREIVIDFKPRMSCRTHPKAKLVEERIKIKIPLRTLSNIREIGGVGERSLVIDLDKPPEYYRKIRDLEASFNDGRIWVEKKAFVRLTHLQHGEDRVECPLTLKGPPNCFVDLGRWTSYKLQFLSEHCDRSLYAMAKSAMQDYNITYQPDPQFKSIPARAESIWTILDVRTENLTSVAPNPQLPWTVRYQLESCISLGCFNERNIDRAFILKLSEMSERSAMTKLEVAADKQQRFFNPHDIFDLPIPRRLLTKKVPKHCILQRSATVTPTTVYYSVPTMEMSNRILRKYQEHSDRFLRVRFTDEKHSGRLTASVDKDDISVSAPFNRIWACLTRGITIGDRHFEFLASGNSQFRENGAYFFAPTEHLSTERIRQEMGSFDDIKIVAKYASRLGQCFSTTRGIRISLKMVESADIERNGFNFTDGVGKISPNAASLIAGELGLPTGDADRPSVFQFRMGGCKGVVAVAPELAHCKMPEVHIRPSQYKFDAILQGFEVIRCSSFGIPRLNRQLITVFKSLGISDNVFMRLMELELKALSGVVDNENIALQALQQQVDFNQMTLEVASIVFDGFLTRKDPFAVSVLRLWQSYSRKQLKEKAALSIHEGAFLLGCTDESATLRGYFHAAQPGEGATKEESIRALPEIFVQISDLAQKGAYRIIEGVCVVARNPSLHPGDIRVVKAVNNPRLCHLRNVVVFPQTGDQDIASMCSGGDLDGDDFVVIWDARLIPHHSQWNVAPMDFTGPTPARVDKVTIPHIAKFFVNFMQHDRLRTIATWHLAQADRLEGGVNHPYCLELANLHSIAVDFPKTGEPAEPDLKLQPAMYPHFMPSQYRLKSKIYKSRTILGQLFDKVPDHDFRPFMEMTFDTRILDAFKIDATHLTIMAEIKAEYDTALRRIMNKHDIATEFEVWTTWVMEHARIQNDYKIHEEIGRESSALKEHFVDICHAKAGTKDFEDFAPWLAAMYKVTADEATEKLVQLRKKYDAEALAKISPTEFPLISFPWLFHRELGRIARGKAAAALSNLGMLQAAPKLNRKANVIHADLEGLQWGGTELHTASGVAHAGDNLVAFRKPEQGENGVKAGEEARSEAKMERDQKIMVEKDDLSGSEGFKAAQAARAAMIDASITGPPDASSRRPRGLNRPGNTIEDWLPTSNAQHDSAYSSGGSPSPTLNGHPGDAARDYDQGSKKETPHLTDMTNRLANLTASGSDRAQIAQSNGFLDSKTNGIQQPPMEGVFSAFELEHMKRNDHDEDDEDDYDDPIDSGAGVAMNKLLALLED